MGNLNESMLNGSSAIYVEQMHSHWLKDPSSVHSSWREFFQNVENGVAPGNAQEKVTCLIDPQNVAGAAFMPPPSLSGGVAAAPAGSSVNPDARQVRKKKMCLAQSNDR